MKQVEFQLKNKLKVILVQSPKSPVVSVQMWVKTGSADEKKSEEGISHFIEHLVFKGTEKFKLGEVAQLVEASGGELNAYTSFDQTVFYVTISKNFSDVALDVVSQMMGYPTFVPEEVDSEREVVCEEIKMGQDSPGRRSSKLMFSAAFKKHPYGLPVIGYEKNVRTWSVKKIKEFYHSRYVPQNMFLVVTGDFEIPEMKRKIQQYYSGFKDLKVKKVVRQKEPAQKKYQYLFEKNEIQDKHLHFVFKAPNVKHKDVPALDVLAMVLGQGDSSLLVKKLRLESPIVSGVSAFSFNPLDQGLFAVSAQFQQGDKNISEKFNEVANEILKQIDYIQNNPPSWNEIKRSCVGISSEQFYSIETVDGLAGKIGGLEFYTNDINSNKKYLKDINNLTPEDIQKVAKKYLKLDQLSVAFMGSNEKVEMDKLLKTIPVLWKKNISIKKNKLTKDKKIKIPKLILKSTPSNTKMKIEKIEFDSGMKLLLSKQADTPTVSAKFIFSGGARNETPSTMGLSEFASRVWTCGTEDKNEAQLMQEMEELAMGFSPFSGKNTFGFSIEYLTAFEKEALNLSFDVITQSPFTSDIIEREKQIVLQQIKSKEDHPSSLCVRQFLQKMFPHHPISYDALGTSETVNAFNRESIIELKNKILNPKNLTVAVVGDYNRAEWINRLKKFEKQILNNKTKSAKNTEYKITVLNKNENAYLQKDKEQSHVIVGWRGLKITDPNRYVLQAIQAILAGQGGRLFTELRDKNSLAYSVSPMKMESLETGYFGGYIACSPEKVEKAIQMFHAEFEKIRNEKVSIFELERAKKFLIGQHDIGLQRKSSLCNLIGFDEFYGNDYNQSLNVADEYNKITLDQIQSLANELFSKPYVVSIVGRAS